MKRYKSIFREDGSQNLKRKINDLFIKRKNIDERLDQLARKISKGYKSFWGEVATYLNMIKRQPNKYSLEWFDLDPKHISEFQKLRNQYKQIEKEIYQYADKLYSD